MQFLDAAALAGTRRTADGYLVAEVKTARTGIQDYCGWEVGKAAMDRVRVYRPPEQVFSKDSLASYAHKPVTDDHPSEAVTADNWKKLSVGQIGDEVARDGEFVRIPLIVMDKGTIDKIEAGKQELSAGYVCDLDWTSGVTPQGETYDAIQTQIRINHVAIVDRGRAGPEARIGDNAFNWGACPSTVADKEKPMDLRKIMVDGLQVETTDAGAAAIEKLTNDKASVQKAFDDAKTNYDKALATKDAEIAKKDAEIEELKKSKLSDADLDKLVKDRADLVAQAKTIANDIQTDGLSIAEIKKAVVKAVCGDAAVNDRSEAYIDARFDVLAENKPDPFRDAMKGKPATPNTNDNGQAAYEKRLNDAWKGDK